MDIKHYIFDFGDVFINLDKAATKRALEKLGMTDFTPEMLAKNKDYEKGLISTEAFLEYYQKYFPEASKEELRSIWNKILLDFPEYRLEFIEAFSKTHDCYLLSNINEIHVDFIKEQLGAEFYNRFTSCFKKVYYTHEIHLRKPDKAIYEFVFQENGLQPEDCFFVDDKIENIQTAADMGVTCWHIKPGEDDIIYLEQYLSPLTQ